MSTPGVQPAARRIAVGIVAMAVAAIVALSVSTRVLGAAGPLSAGPLSAGPLAAAASPVDGTIGGPTVDAPSKGSLDPSAAAAAGDAAAALTGSGPARPPATAAPLSAVPGASVPSPRRAVPAAASAAAPSGDETAVLALVNAERAKVGCPALTMDARLTTAARGHSQDMASRGYFAHDTPEGVGMATRVTNAGYRWSAVAENIAMGYPDPASVMSGWMNSPGHRTNILHCQYRQIGVGVAANANSARYWTQDFGTPG